MAPLTWLRLIGDPRKAKEWLYHNNGCYPSVTQPNCMFVWNNPLQATKGKPRAALIHECIPGDLNTSPSCAKKETCHGQGRLYTPDVLRRLSSRRRLQHCIRCNVHRCNGLACRSALSGLSMHMRCAHMTSYDHTLALGWKIAALPQCNRSKLLFPDVFFFLYNQPDAAARLHCMWQHELGILRYTNIPWRIMM